MRRIKIRQKVFIYGKYNAYYYAGLDCCGYVGWTLYNTLHSESGKRGYVGVGAEGFAKHLCELGFGEWTQNIFEPQPYEVSGTRKSQ